MPKPLLISQLLDRLHNDIKVCKMHLDDDYQQYLSRMYQRECIRLMSLQLQREVDSLTCRFYKDTGIRLLGMPDNQLG